MAFIELRLNTDWEDRNAAHNHDLCTIIFVLSQGGNLLINQELFPFLPGSLFVIPSGATHMSNAFHVTYSRYIIQFPPSFLPQYSTSSTDLEKIYQHIHFAQLSPAERQLLEDRLRSLTHPHQGYGADLKDRLDLLYLLIDIAQLLETHGEKEQEIEFSPTQRRVKEMIAYIHSHLQQPLSLDDMAQKFFVNKYHLCRLFKENTGITLGAYIRQSRLCRAKLLLRSGQSIQQTAEQTGFRNVSHFIRIFGEHTGISPGKYAKEQNDAILGTKSQY